MTENCFYTHLFRYFIDVLDTARHSLFSFPIDLIEWIHQIKSNRIWQVRRRMMMIMMMINLSSLAFGPLAMSLSGLHWMCSSSIRSYENSNCKTWIESEKDREHEKDGEYICDIERWWKERRWKERRNKRGEEEKGQETRQIYEITKNQSINKDTENIQS